MCVQGRCPCRFAGTAPIPECALFWTRIRPRQPRHANHAESMLSGHGSGLASPGTEMKPNRCFLDTDPAWPAQAQKLSRIDVFWTRTRPGQPSHRNEAESTTIRRTMRQPIRQLKFPAENTQYRFLGARAALMASLCYGFASFASFTARSLLCLLIHAYLRVRRCHALVGRKRCLISTGGGQKGQTIYCIERFAVYPFAGSCGLQLAPLHPRMQRCCA